MATAHGFENEFERIARETWEKFAARMRGKPIDEIRAALADEWVTLCSSSGFAHGVRTTGRKVVYCYTSPRWLYDGLAPTWPAGLWR